MKKILISLISLFMIITLFGCKNTNQKIDEHLNKKEYFEAYQLALEMTTIEEELVDKIVLQWQQAILENDTIDENFVDLNIYDNENMYTFANNILKYLYEKQTPNNQQLELINSLFDGVKDIKTNNPTTKKILKALDDYSNVEKIWVVKERESISYEEYYSKEHLYSEETMPKIVSKEASWKTAMVFDEFGMYVNILFDVDNSIKQYVLFKEIDYPNIQPLTSDGYWTYIKQKNELFRININGEIEELFTFGKEFPSGVYFDFKLIDYDVALFNEIKDDVLYIHRIYLPENKIDTFKTMLSGIACKESGLDQQTSSNHILYIGINQAYLEKVEYLKLHQDLYLNLYKKHINQNLDEETKKSLLECLENPIDSSGVKDLKEIIVKEYGIHTYTKYDLNILTDETKVKQVAPENLYGNHW